MGNIIEVFIGMVSIIFDRMNVILPFFSFANVGSVGANLRVCPTIANSADINKQTEFSFANVGSVGANLRVCPAIVNSVGINKQTGFSFANADTNCKLASKENLRQQIGFVIRNS
jgi:hypothetical protein